jgi:hypothetical protein
MNAFNAPKLETVRALGDENGYRGGGMRATLRVSAFHS